MAEYTLTYSEGSAGWPSFYSYIPEYMIGMNNYFYTFKNGNLYRHNTNALRNNYYGDGSVGSSITSVFNQAPIQTKIFKTIGIESDDAWGAVFTTDLQSGSIDVSFLEKKEANWFGFIRYNTVSPAAASQYALRSVNGVGDCTTITNSGGGIYIINFGASGMAGQNVDVGSMISINDSIYQMVGANPVFRGVVTAFTSSSITIDTAGGSVPVAVSFTLYIKNNTAESYGLLGHYCEFTLTNNSTSAVELFNVESDVMKSYP